MSIEKEKETDGLGCSWDFFGVSGTFLGVFWGPGGTWKADQSAKPKAIAIGVNDGALHILFHLLNLTVRTRRKIVSEYFVKLGSLEG